jgi:GNAT superfamily N-acetyltransferase
MLSTSSNQIEQEFGPRKTVSSALSAVAEERLPVDYTIAESEQDLPEEREAIENLLRAYNAAQAPPALYRPLRLTIKDNAGQVIGGLTGHSSYEWLFVSILIVQEPLRGQGLGTRLMQQAEQIARERGLTGIWLDTFDFQARPFYEKLGFTVFGELKDHPRGISQWWLQKRLG